MMSYNEMSVEELGSFVSDFHKDLYGFRPRHIDFNNKEELVRAANKLDDEYESMRGSPEGRQNLRDMGWVVPEEKEEVQFVYQNSYQPPVLGELFRG
jgi:hypothetical protein